MVKISRNTVIILFILAAISASIHPLFALPELPYKLFLIYGIMFTATFFLAADIKAKKEEVMRFVLFSAGSVLLVAGQYIFSFFKHNIIIYGVLLMLAGIAVIAAAFLIYGTDKEEPGHGYGVKAEIISLILLAGAAFALRFWNLENFLPGIWFDEAQNGNEALRILNDNKLEVFISRYTHMPAMYFYFGALAIKIFGFNIFSLRLVSCVLGVLSILAFYFLAKQIFKDAKYALLCAVLLAFSRWHITFSRVAFLGMQTVLFEILFLYFYLKFFETKSYVHAVLAGLLLGLAQYTFSAANFIAVFAAMHVGAAAIKDFRVFIPAYARGIILMAAMSLIAAAPLIDYAVKSKGAFFQRARDISIMNDIKNNKSIMPLLKNLKAYSLVFNFEGDYNGRHNLYKRPILDDIGGVFLIIGLISAFLISRYRFIAGLMLIMLLPGILTITIEAPQTYRIIGVIPAVYIIIGIGIKMTAGMIAGLSKNKAAIPAFMTAAAVSVAAINLHQYYMLYPKHEGTYMSYSPEANGIAKFINKYVDAYEILVSTAEKMYGFYMWEQNVICDFINYGKKKIRYLSKSNEINSATLATEKGVIVITRPTDAETIKALEAQYAGKISKKEVYTNPYTGAEIYSCWFINKADLLTAAGKIIYVK